MVTLGVVQVVEDESPNTHVAATKYCMVHGKPRANVVSSQQVVEDIADAQTEIRRSEKRCKMLKQALLTSQSNTMNPREVLKQLLLKYPEVANDPVYMAAFRNTHVDVASVERERLKQLRSKLEKKGGVKEAKSSLRVGTTREGTTVTKPKEATS